MHSIVVRTFARDEWPLYRALRLAALQESPDAFGSSFAHESLRADDDWATRIAGGASSVNDLPLVAELEGEPSGLAWVRLEDEGDAKVAHLYQMWVTPTKRKHGVGRALLEAAVDWARGIGAEAVLLDVTTGNSDAARLYETAGFTATGNEKPLRPGSELRSRLMRRSLDSDSPDRSP